MGTRILLYNVACSNVRRHLAMVCLIWINYIAEFEALCRYCICIVCYFVCIAKVFILQKNS